MSFIGKITGLRLIGAAGLAALGVQATYGAAPPNDIDGLAASLGDAIGGVVAAKDVRWEPSEGLVADYTEGRWALFLGAASAGAPRDVYRARVRLAPDGHPLTIGAVYNLTTTPLGDDHALTVDGDRAAFATYSYGQEQSVSALGLRGENAPAEFSLLQRLTRFLTNEQQKGEGSGIARVDITLDPPAKHVVLELKGDTLGIGGTTETGPERADVNLARAEVAGAPLHVEPVRELPKPLVLWAVDTVRAVPWIGPAPIAWLEERVFWMKDTAKQLAFKLHGEDPSDELKANGDVAPQPAAVLASKAAVDDASWPPQNLSSIWKQPEPGEGVWVQPKLPWQKHIDAAPPAFMRTFVRPDSERPYSEVILVAMDMRQLDLQMEAGSEDPKPLTGNHGPGRIPRDPAISSRVVAAFNGAFKTEHGNYGMMVHGRVLLPPQPGAASVVVLKDGRSEFGTWGQNQSIGGIHGVHDADIDSFRQNLDPLVDNGEVNPTKRSLWGYTLPGNGMQTERSGMCVTGAGQIIYAWGEDASATTLAKAMKMAGCTYGMHLDMNPKHTGFIFSSIDDLKARKYRSETLTPLMEISTDRYLEYAPKDFFYVLLRDPTPPPLGDAKWIVDAGVQPAPTWMPGIWSTKSGDVELLDVEASRAAYRVRAGKNEPDGHSGGIPVSDLAQADASHVLFAVTVGMARDKHPRGLATEGRIVMPVRGNAESAVLVTTPQGDLSIETSTAAVADLLGTTGDFTELPLLVDAGAVTSLARSNAGEHADERRSRAGLGITHEGRVIIARADTNSDAVIADALVKAGCQRAVLLDRGARAPVTFDRAGTSSPPRARYDESVLYAVARPMKPRAVRFTADTSVADASKPTR
ncbi:MAG: phosphodiester glycosidase family protein [Polyangiaceae bacterium]